jgi:hypothetical protein
MAVPSQAVVATALKNEEVCARNLIEAVTLSLPDTAFNAEVRRACG